MFVRRDADGVTRDPLLHPGPDLGISQAALGDSQMAGDVTEDGCAREVQARLQVLWSWE